MISKVKNDSFISQLIMLILGLVNLKFTITIFGLESFGLINLYISIFLIFISIFGFRVWESGIYSINKCNSENNSVKSVYFFYFKIEIFVNIILSIIFVLSIYLFNKLSSNNYDIYFLAFLFLANVSKELSNQILISLINLRYYYYTKVLQPSVFFLGLTLVYFFNISATIKLYFFIYILSIFTVSFVSFYFAYTKKLKFCNSKKYKPNFNLLQFTKVSYFSTTARSFWERTDYLWINFLTTSETLGIYAITKKIMDYFTLINFTYWNSLKPRFTSNYDSKKAFFIVEKYQKNVLKLAFIILILLILFSQLITSFFNINNAFIFYQILFVLFFVSCLWSLVSMSRYIVTLYKKLYYSLKLNIMIAIIFNLIIVFNYYILDLNGLISFLVATLINSFIAFIYWNNIFKKIKLGLK